MAPLQARLGAVLSILMPLTVVVAVLPAASMAAPLADWPALSPLRVMGEVQEATPDMASLQLKDTVTSVLFQP